MNKFRLSTSLIWFTNCFALLRKDEGSWSYNRFMSMRCLRTKLKAAPYSCLLVDFAAQNGTLIEENEFLPGQSNEDKCILSCLGASACVSIECNTST